MDRRSLLKIFGVVAATATVAPATLASIAKARVYPPDAPMWFASKEPADQVKSIYVALFSGDKEISGGCYERQPVRFTSAVKGAAGNAEDVVFPTATADWGTITHMKLLDSKHGETMFVGPLSVPRVVEGPECCPKDTHYGDTFKFLAGDINIDLNDGGHGVMTDRLAAKLIKQLLTY